MNNKLNLNFKSVPENVPNTLMISGFTINNLEYIDLNEFSIQTKKSLKTTQRFIKKITSSSELNNKKYIFKIGKPYKIYINKIFVDKQIIKLINKSHFNINKLDNNISKIDISDMLGEQPFTTKYIEDYIENKLNKATPKPSKIILEDQEFFSKKQKEFTLFFDKYDWCVFSNFHFEIHNTLSEAEEQTRKFFLKLKKKTDPFLINFKALYVIERNKGIEGGYHVHLLFSLTETDKFEVFYKILLEQTLRHKGIFNVKNEKYHSELMGLRYVFKTVDSKNFTFGFEDSTKII